MALAPGSLPHITLGFDPRFAVGQKTGTIFEDQKHFHSMKVDRVALAKMGRHGRVKHVFAR